MTYIIPNQTTKEIKQLNINNLLGDIFTSKNIDLSERGYIKLAHRTVATMTIDDDADFVRPTNMVKSLDNVYLAATEVFAGTIGGLGTLTNRKTDTTPPHPGVNSDSIYFNSKEVISNSTGISYRSASTTWTFVDLTSEGISNSASPTVLAVFDTYNALLVANLNKVTMVDTSWAVIRTLTIPNQYNITSIAVNNNTVAIATRHKASKETKMFIWDGSTTAHNGAFPVKAPEIYSVKSYKASFALVTSRGELLKFNGGGFDSLAKFPIYYSRANWTFGPSDTNIAIGHRGMIADGEDIYINLFSVSTDNRTRFNKYFPGGIWRYSESSGLNCMYTPSYTRVQNNVIATSDVNTTTNVITVSAAPVTGTPVLYDSAASTVMAGVSEKKLYYIIKVSSTTIKLATTLANANAGTAVDITGTGNNSQSLKAFLVNDYGWSYTKRSGCLELLDRVVPVIANPLYSFYVESLIMTGVLFAKQTTATEKSVFNVITPLLPNIGYFITPKLVSSGIEDLYNTVALKYRTLGTDDVIKLKYRITDRYGMPVASTDKGQELSGTSAFAGVWSDTNTFTTTVDMSGCAVGDEIEIHAGVGAGWSSHIESISESGGTYTVNLTDSFIFAVASDVMYFSCDNWAIFETITAATQNGDGYYEKAFDKNSKFMQVKVELNGVDILIEELRVNNAKFKNDR